MKLSSQSQNDIASAIASALANFPVSEEQPAVTDIHLQPNGSTGELWIWDDDDRKLADTPVKEWMDYDSDDFYIQTEGVLRTILKQLKEQNALENVGLMKPYSFTLTDENKETVAELMLVDDDTLLLDDDDLLKGLDDDLNDFLKNLLEK